MATTLMPNPKNQFFDNNGKPLTNGKVYTYAAGTTENKATWTDPAGTTQQPNPIPLNQRGEPDSPIYWDGAYKIVVRDAQGNVVYTVDNFNTDPLGIKQFLSSLASSVGATLIGFLASGASAVMRTIDSVLRDRVVITNFMTPTELSDYRGETNTGSDHTSAIMKAWAYCKTYHAGSMVWPRGNIITKSQLVFEDVYFKSFIFEGVTIGGGATSSQDAVFKIVNAQNFKMTGAVTVSADASAFATPNDPNKYAAAVSLQTAPGGAIEPTNGILNFVDISGLTVTKAKRGITIGAYDNDAQVAELTIHGLMTPFCPNPVYVGGSQTVVTFVGGSITSSDWPAITSPEYITFLIEGAGVTVLGGEVTNHGTSAGRVVDLRPGSSITYQNPYGAFNAVGSLIETKWPCARVNNPRLLPAPLSFISHVSLSACYGYSGDLPGDMGFMSIDDPGYAGRICIDESCHFYQTAASPVRSVATINCSTSPNAIVSVGRNSFRNGYPFWMAGVAGGRLLHGLELCIQAFVNGGTSSAGVSYLKPTAISNSPRYQRYSGQYDLSTGIFTVPATVNGIDTIRFEVSILTGSAAGDIYLLDVSNNRIMGFGQNVNGIASMVQTVSDFAAGQKFAVVTNLNADVSFGGSVTNNVNIYIGTN